MCENVLHMLKARRYAYLENLNCNGPVSESYRRLMEVKNFGSKRNYWRKLNENKKPSDIIIA